MRKIFFLFAFVSIASTISVNAQNDKDYKDKPKIEGSGNIITKTVNVQPFDQIDVSGVFSLKLSQGNKEEVKIEADDNLQDLFEVKNDGSKLTIKMKKESNFNSKKGLKVYISFKKLKSMDLQTVGNVSSEESMSFDDLKIGNKSVGQIDLKLTAQSLNIYSTSVGDVKLNGKADNAVIRSKGVGSLDAANFVVQKMDIDMSGVGSARVNAEKELKIKDSFLGRVSNKGAAPVKRTKKVVI
jgi:hypothetical protein